MNRAQFLILFAVLVVLAAAGAGIVVSERSSSTSADSRIGRKIAPGLRLGDVAEIAIRDGAGELHLAKGEGGWTVRERAGFAADTGRIGDLLLKLAELKIVQEESVPESQRARLQLVEPKDGTAATGAGTLLELKDAKGATLVRLLLGRKVMKNAETASPGRDPGEATGRYLVSAIDAKMMWVVAEPLAQVEPKADQWLVKDLIQVERVKSIASTGPGGKPRWTVTRDNDNAEWKFSGSKEKPDLQKATDLASAFSWMSISDVVADPAKATGLDRAVTIKAGTFDGFIYTLRIGNKAGDNYNVGIEVAGEPPKARTPEKGEKAADKAGRDKELDERRKKLGEKLEREKQFGRWIYLIGKNSIEPLLRERAQLLPEKKKDVKKTTKKI